MKKEKETVNGENKKFLAIMVWVPSYLSCCQIPSSKRGSDPAQSMSDVSLTICQNLLCPP